MDNVTMVDASWGSRHRSAAIGKVENGYEVKAEFPVRKQEQYDPSKRTLTFVFATLSETIAWVNWYFTEDAETLLDESGARGPAAGAA